MINNVYLAIPKECPHLKPHLLPGDLFISITFKGRGGGGRRAKSTRGIFEMGALFCLAKTMVSVLLKELKYKVEKHKYEKLEVVQPRINKRSKLPVGE